MASYGWIDHWKWPPVEAIFEWDGEQILTRQVDLNNSVWGKYNKNIVFYSTPTRANNTLFHTTTNWAYTNEPGETITYTVGTDLHVGQPAHTDTLTGEVPF